MNPASTMPALLSASGIPSPPESVWYLGPLPLRAYALAILLGIVLASVITIRRYKARGGPDEAFLDMLIVAVPLGIVGARIYHVLTHYEAYFGPGADPWEVLQIWRGGLAIIGAIIFGSLGAWLVLRRKGLRLAPMADSIAPALLVAQAVGRLGNYFNQELFGGPTDLPWGLQIEPHILQAHGIEPGTLVHPTFLYEMIWNLAMAALIVLLDRKIRFANGQVFALYMMAYGTGRFWIEMLRMDPAQEFAGLRMNSWAALAVVVAGILLFLFLGRRKDAYATTVWLPGRAPKDDVGQDAGTGGGTSSGPGADGDRAKDAEPEAGGREDSRAPEGSD